MSSDFQRLSNLLERDLRDNQSIYFGSDRDVPAVLTSAGVAANTPFTDGESRTVLIGTPVSQAIAANSLIVSNITASGDMALYGNLGGNSIQWLLYDTSASRIYAWPNGAAGLDWTSAAATFTSAASTANQVVTIQNTSNAAAASHAYLDIAVGGTTSTGDPQVRWTIPGGNSWYAGPDNSDGSDRFFVGASTVVGAGGIIRLDQSQSGTATLDGRLTILNRTFTANNAATANIISFYIEASTLTLSGTTTVTNPSAMVYAGALTIIQSGGAVIVNSGAGVISINPTAGASVTLTHSSAYRALTGGAAVNVSGLYVEPQTAGTTGNYQILLANGGTEPPALANHVGIYTVDETAEAVLGLATENAVAADADETKFSNKLRVRINGATYYIMLTVT